MTKDKLQQNIEKMIVALEKERATLKNEPDERKFPIQEQVINWALGLFYAVLEDRV